MGNDSTVGTMPTFISWETTSQQDRFLDFLDAAEWKAAGFLRTLLAEGTFYERLGESSQLFFVTEGDEIMGFCALVEQDFNPIPEYRPWISFIYVHPDFRGNRLSEKMIDFLEGKARDAGWNKTYIVTQHHGLYQKYGYQFVKSVPSPKHDEDFVYVGDLR